MHFFRNPEIRNSIFLYLATGAILAAAGSFLVCLLPLPGTEAAIYRLLLICFLLFVCLA